MQETHAGESAGPCPEWQANDAPPPPRVHTPLLPQRPPSLFQALPISSRPCWSLISNLSLKWTCSISSNKNYYVLTSCGFRRYKSVVMLQIKCREWIITFWIRGIPLNGDHYCVLIKIPLIIKIIFWGFNTSIRDMQIKLRDRHRCGLLLNPNKYWY